MAYAPPTITAAGLTIPSYADILAYYLSQYQQIYGQSVALTIATSDYQWISVIALLASDTMQGIQLSYNSRGPLTAVGVALDGILKLNGLARLQASYSTCYLVLTGTTGVTTTITNGVAQDVNNNLWDLPTPVTIPTSGTLTVQATAVNPGAINANPGDINSIYTPTAGWLSVNNAVAAVAGTAVELDSHARARQSISVALPSQTRLAGTVAAIAQTSGVTRYNVAENATAAVDANGNPPHSITAVVEGGSDTAVATSIFQNRGIGPFTNGTTSVVITDPDTGYLSTISFDRPTYVPIYVIANVHGLTGFSSATLTQIQTDIVAYLNSLQIGAELAWGETIAAALNARSDPQMPTYTVNSLFLGTTASPTGTANIVFTFNQVAQGLTGNVTVNSV